MAWGRLAAEQVARYLAATDVQLVALQGREVAGRAEVPVVGAPSGIDTTGSRRKYCNCSQSAQALVAVVQVAGVAKPILLGQHRMVSVAVCLTWVGYRRTVIEVVGEAIVIAVAAGNIDVAAGSVAISAPVARTTCSA